DILFSVTLTSCPRAGQRRSHSRALSVAPIRLSPAKRHRTCRTYLSRRRPLSFPSKCRRTSGIALPPRRRLWLLRTLSSALAFFQLVPGFCGENIPLPNPFFVHQMRLPFSPPLLFTVLNYSNVNSGFDYSES